MDSARRTNMSGRRDAMCGRWRSRRNGCRVLVCCAGKHPSYNGRDDVLLNPSSNGCGLDIGVKNGKVVGVRGRITDRVNRGRLGPKGLHG
jgi:hypothetical protein